MVGDLLNHFRNLMVFQVSKGDVVLLEISEAEQSALVEQAKLADAAAASRILEVFAECEYQLRGAASRKILVEVSIMKAIDAASAMSLNDVLDHLQQLRAEGGNAPAPVSVANSPAPKQTAKAKLEKPAEVKQESVAQPAAAPTPKLPSPLACSRRRPRALGFVDGLPRAVCKRQLCRSAFEFCRKRRALHWLSARAGKRFGTGQQSQDP